MSLDLPTLMVMQSFAMASAGAILMCAWLQGRSAPALALWGLANVIAAAGIIGLMLGATLHEPLALAVGGALMPLQSGLMWKATRRLEGKPTPLVLALMGPALFAVAAGVPAVRAVMGSLCLVAGACYVFATGATFWSGRGERLMARWPLIILCALHGTTLSIGTWSTLVGSTGQDGVPAILSLFGFIYFESIVFALATSVFVFALVKERSELASTLAARTDSLTGIANRAAFLANALQVLESCRRRDEPASVLMFDLDRFKAINDKYGHAVGDDVIKAFCQVALAALGTRGVLGRMGGEEFAALLPSVGVEAACLRAERIRLSFSEPGRFVRGHRVNATVSAGVATLSGSTETLSTLLESADAALYRAKADGRNRIGRAGQGPAGASGICQVA